MRKPHKILSVIVINLLMIGFFLSIYITVDEKIPGNAVVVVTIEDRMYHSIHFDEICVSGKQAKTMTLTEAVAKGFKPHPHCHNLGYFRGNRLFLFHYMLSKMGMQFNSRWDTDGNWLW
jgi:hypothetical protein